MNTIVKAVEKKWALLTYDERENISLAQDIAREELRAINICNETVGETLNLIALQLTTLLLNTRIIVGADELTIEQYKERVSFLLLESLDNGLVQYLEPLEVLFNRINGDELYTLECAIGDYIYLNRKVGVSNESI